MKNFKHYIFTRFNLLDDFDGLKTIYNNPDVPDPEAWMEHRMDLFRKFTLPSIKAQTCQDFIWLLSFAKETPLRYTAAAGSCRNTYHEVNRYGRVRIIYEYPRTWLRKNFRKGWLITSRIDNDDYYMPEFIETVQNQRNIFEPEIVDIDYRKLDIIKGEFYTSARRTPNSPFLSLVEYVKPGTEAKTCYCYSHTNMPQHFRARKINEPLAVMVLHDKNISNKIEGNETKL